MFTTVDTSYTSCRQADKLAWKVLNPQLLIRSWLLFKDTHQPDCIVSEISLFCKPSGIQPSCRSNLTFFLNPGAKKWASEIHDATSAVEKLYISNKLKGNWPQIHRNVELLEFTMSMYRSCWKKSPRCMIMCIHMTLNVNMYIYAHICLVAFGGRMQNHNEVLFNQAMEFHRHWTNLEGWDTTPKQNALRRILVKTW